MLCYPYHMLGNPYARKTKYGRSPYLAEIHDHFLNKRSHGCNVDDLELSSIDGSIHVDMFANRSKDGEESNVGFAGTSWGTEQEIFIGFQCCICHTTLNSVQR